jgi:hypothetical protein
MLTARSKQSQRKRFWRNNCKLRFTLDKRFASNLSTPHATIATAMKILVCPHCRSKIPEDARECVCDAKIIRGATPWETRKTGFLFAFCAFLASLVQLGFLYGPHHHAGAISLLILGSIVFVAISYFLGIHAARLLARRKLRFYRVHRI